MSRKLTYSQISAMQFATLEKLIANLTCDALAKEVIIERVRTVMEYHQDLLAGIEEKV